MTKKGGWVGKWMRDIAQVYMVTNKAQSKSNFVLLLTSYSKNKKAINKKYLHKAVKALSPLSE